ncbi:MAG: hypothetical protein JXA00_05805 [Candidatus Thermoplasmatota archaeon]|nr:hypothetical protein [Candidatus Thermoplasmatota archaeon]
MRSRIISNVAIVLVIGVLCASSVTPARLTGELKQAIDDEHMFSVEYTVTFSPDDLTFGSVHGYDTVSLTDGTYTTAIGEPMMPVRQVCIALPDGIAAQAVQVTATEKIQLRGTYTIVPAQEPLPTDNSKPTAAFIEPQSFVYSSSQPYPALQAQILGQADLAGQSWVVLQLNPLQFIPSENQLMLTTSLTVQITGTDGYVCGDYLPIGISDEGRESYEAMVKERVINPQDVQLRCSDHPQPLGVGPGDYDYVIITQSIWTSYFQSLADWKTKKGIPATIVTTTWIYNSGGYSGTYQDKIRAFVQDANTNWGTIYFLLGGDTSYIPYHTRTIEGDAIPNDAYYADFDSDWVCEVNVGRASVTTTGTGAGGIGNFINKITTYEKNPPLTDYAKKAALFGFDLDWQTDAEDCKIYIDNYYIPSSWTMTNVYDSHTGNHKTNVIAAMNAGQNLINHADHSYYDYMGTGDYNHGLGLEISDITGLSNGNKQGILYSMGCWPAAYDYNQCIAEHYVQDTNGGGVAFIGNSRYGWYNPGHVDTLSMLYDRYFFSSLFQQNMYKLGQTFSDHKNDLYPTSDTLKYIWTELTLLGDPELPIWTENPSSITVTHPTTMPLGTSTFLVNTNVPYAVICLWKGSEVYMIGTANSAGDYTFYPNPTTEGTLSVTATKQNYLPYEGSATVIGVPQYTLTVTIDGSGAVTLNPPGGVYDSGTVVQLTANENPGWSFDHWSGDLTGSTNPATITMNGNKAVTAHFTQDHYTLTVNVDGNGTAYKIPDYTYYIYGEIVQTIVLPDLGWSFSHWTGDVPSGHEYDVLLTLTMNSNKELTGHLTQDHYTLTVTTVGSGTVTKTPNQVNYVYGQEVTLTANAATGWHFDHWSGNITGTNNPTVIIMDCNKAVTATFTQNQYTLTTTVNPAGAGSITKNPNQATYTYGQIVQLTANANPGWTFSHWSGALSGSTNPASLTITGNMAVTAHYTQNQYTLTTTVDPTGAGTITRDPEQATYTYGQNVQLTANANTGYTFSHWTGDLTGTTNPDTITITDNMQVTAHFTQNQYTLTILTQGSGSVTKNPNQPTYTYGQLVELNAIPDPGWSFSHWSGDLTGTSNPAYITMDDDKTVTAHFTQNQYTLTITTLGSGTVTKTPEQPTYTYGQIVTLEAFPDPGWSFTAWGGDITSPNNPVDVPITNDLTITCTFTQDQYTLSITILGNGSVTVNPNQPTYVYGDTVTLTATADPGWQFDQWSGAIPSGHEFDNPVVITITGNTLITASFTQQHYILTTLAQGAGEVFKNPDHPYYTYGQVVELTAYPVPGFWHFDHWEGNVANTYDNPTTITMYQNETVTAYFLQDEFTLTIDVYGQGTVLKDPDQPTYHFDDIVQLTANPDPGWSFDHWSGDHTGSTNPDTITITGNMVIGAHFVQDVLLFDLTVFLEGPFNGVDMDTALNTAGFLPLSQPYSTAPWSYSGTETVTSIPNQDIVDWVLVELRETPGDASTATSATMIARQAAFLLNDGSVVSMDGTSLITFDVTITANLYVVICHRNHLNVMSATPLIETAGTYSYDFSTGHDQAYGGYNAHKDIGSGVWGMMGGDGNADGQVNNGDKNDVWAAQAGTSGYKAGDYNMDTQVGNQDKNEIWAANVGGGSQVPI